MADFEKAIGAAAERQTEEQVAFNRAVQAAKMRKSIDLQEQAILETFPESERGAALAFRRWTAGQKWKGGIQAKLAAQAGFIQGFRIAEAAYGPNEDQKEARSSLVLP